MPNQNEQPIQRAYLVGFKAGWDALAASIKTGSLN